MLRNASVLVSLGLLMDVHPLPAADWSPIAPMSEARFGAAAATQGQRLFVLGGFSNQPLAAATAWDGSAWSDVRPMLEPRLFAGAAAASGSVYAIGGFSTEGVPTASAERFDPGTGGWGNIAPMPAPRAACAAGTINGAIVVAGGQGGDARPAPDCFRYDPASDAWSTLGAIPTARSGVAGAVLEDRLWVIGGFVSQPVATVERLDPQSGAWGAGPDLPEPLWFPAAAVLDGRVWVAGGIDASFQRSDRCYSAGPDGLWRPEARLPAALAASAMGTLGDCAVLAGGINASGVPDMVAFSMCVEAPPPPPPPPPPGDTITVAVKITPDILGGSTQGLWIGVHIEPDGWSPRDIALGSLALDAVPVDLSAPVTYDESDTDHPRLIVKFPRAPFASRPSGEYEVVLRGERHVGVPFRGTAHLAVHGTGGTRALRAMRAGDGRTGVIVSLEQAELVKLEIVDLQGRVVARLPMGWLAAGEHACEWPKAGQAMPRGSYFVRLRRHSATDVVQLPVVR